MRTITFGFNFSAACLLLVWSLSGCNSSTPESRGKIDNGQLITADSSNKVDGVFSSITVTIGATMGSGCTGTAVSTTTAMTAGHCVFSPGDATESSSDLDPDVLVLGKKYCINNGLYHNICSTQIFVNKLYLTNSYDFGDDYAYIVFPEGTFKSYFKMNTDALQSGDDILLVGYSSENLATLTSGSKRFGFNKVSFLDPGAKSKIISYAGGSLDSVAVSPGDSGGPVFKECKITAVASTMNIESNSKESAHTNLTNLDNANKLKSSKSGYFCGLSGDDEVKCPRSLAFQQRTPLTGQVGGPSKDFPCAVDLTQPPNVNPQVNSTIFAAFNDSNELQMRGDTDLSNLSACIGESLELAKSCATKLDVRQQNNQFTSTLTLKNAVGEYFVKITAIRISDKITVEQMIKISKK